MESGCVEPRTIVAWMKQIQAVSLIHQCALVTRMTSATLVMPAIALLMPS